jgi:hypothetical protein
VILGCTFFIFSEPNEEISNIIGWVDIGIIISIVILNLVVLWVMKIIMIAKEIKQYYDARYRKVDRLDQILKQIDLQRNECKFSHVKLRGKNSKTSS